MNRTIVLCLLLLFGSAAAVQGQYCSVKSSGVEIYFEWKQDMFPDKWSSEPICGEALDLEVSEMTRSCQIIQKAISKYPDTVIQQNLNSVYVMSYLSFFNTSYGGSNSVDNIYLTNRGIEKQYTDEYIERLFHAEFSSILLRKYPDYFDKLAWKAHNSDQSVYGNGGLRAIQLGRNSENQEVNNYLSGFLTEYGRSSVENDFNSFAKQIFCPGEDLWMLLRRYPRLRKKYELVVQFYQSIHADFSEDYFKSYAN